MKRWILILIAAVAFAPALWGDLPPPGDEPALEVWGVAQMQNEVDLKELNTKGTNSRAKAREAPGQSGGPDVGEVDLSGSTLKLPIFGALVVDADPRASPAESLDDEALSPAGGARG